MIIYSHKRKAPFEKKDFLPPFFLKEEVRIEVVESNQKIANSRNFRGNGKAVYRLKEIPACKSIPQKGTKMKELGNVEWKSVRENRQSAECGGNQDVR